MPLTQAKRVVRSDLWLNPVFDARLAQEQDISLGVFPVRTNAAESVCSASSKRTSSYSPIPRSISGFWASARAGTKAVTTSATKSEASVRTMAATLTQRVVGTRARQRVLAPEGPDGSGRSPGPRRLPCCFRRFAGRRLRWGRHG